MKQRRNLISFKNRKDLKEKKDSEDRLLKSKRTKVCITNLAEESTSADLTSAMISELLKKVIQVKHNLQRFLTLMNLFCFEAHSS